MRRRAGEQLSKDKPEGMQHLTWDQIGAWRGLDESGSCLRKRWMRKQSLEPSPVKPIAGHPEYQPISTAEISKALHTLHEQAAIIRDSVE